MRTLTMAFITCASIMGGTQGPSPGEQYLALVKEYEDQRSAVNVAYNKATTEEDRDEALARRPIPHTFAGRFFALAENFHDDPVAIDSLIWISRNCIFSEESRKALELLASDHVRSDRLEAFCWQISTLVGEPFKPVEDFLRAVQKGNPHREVQGLSRLGLAHYLKMAKERTERELIGLTIRKGRPISPARLQELKGRRLDKMVEESTENFERVIKDYDDIKINGVYATSGEDAKAELFELRNLFVGSPSAEIQGQDIFGGAMKLSDYRGKVVVLEFGSHRRCPPCRAMYPALRALVKSLEDKPFALLGINIDDDRDELKRLVEKGDITWRSWWDGVGLGGPIADRWIIRNWPTTYVLDQEGIIRNKGFLQVDEIEGTVTMILREMEAARP